MVYIKDKLMHYPQFVPTYQKFQYHSRFSQNSHMLDNLIYVVNI